MTNQVEKKWYIVQTLSGMESKAATLLRALIAESDLQDHFGQVLIPSEQVLQTQRNGKSKKVESKLYPGYLFIEMQMNFATFDFVKNANYIISFLGAERGKHPDPVDPLEIERIQQKIQETVESPRPKVQYEVGEKVRVLSGPFEEFVGVIQAIDYEKFKVQILLSILGRETDVNLEFAQIEKVK